jgi:4-hydroxy-2-oxoheptanedioate aldolase
LTSKRERRVPMADVKIDKQGRNIAVGVFQFLPFPCVSRYLAQMGWDWVLLDAQHGLFTPESIYECIHTIQAAGSRAFVRVPIGDGTAIQKALDAGAQGIVVPMINTRRDAELAVQAAKYPPLGERSIGGDPWYHYGADYPKHANERTLLLVQIEHMAAVKAARQILSVEGVNGCFVGPSDLALSLGLGHVNFEKNPSHQSSIREVVQVSLALRKPSYIHCTTVDEAKERVHQGFDSINLSADIDIFIKAAKGLLAHVRKELKDPDTTIGRVSGLGDNM